MNFIRSALENNPNFQWSAKASRSSSPKKPPSSKEVVMEKNLIQLLKDKENLKPETSKKSTPKDKIDQLYEKATLEEQITKEKPYKTKTIQKKPKIDKIQLHLMNKSRKVPPPDQIKQISGLGYPQPLPLKGTSKRKYQILVNYVDKDGKERQKTVKFGKRTVDDYVDHHDEKKRYFMVNRLKASENPLEPNFWRLYLLNSKHDDLDKAYLDLRKLVLNSQTPNENMQIE